MMIGGLGDVHVVRSVDSLNNLLKNFFILQRDDWYLASHDNYILLHDCYFKFHLVYILTRVTKEFDPNSCLLSLCCCIYPSNIPVRIVPVLLRYYILPVLLAMEFTLPHLTWACLGDCLLIGGELTRSTTSTHTEIYTGHSSPLTSPQTEFHRGDGVLAAGQPPGQSDWDQLCELYPGEEVASCTF